jgi:hypothetical protein
MHRVNTGHSVAMVTKNYEVTGPVVTSNHIEVPVQCDVIFTVTPDEFDTGWQKRTPTGVWDVLSYRNTRSKNSFTMIFRMKLRGECNENVLNDGQFVRLQV